MRRELKFIIHKYELLFIFIFKFQQAKKITPETSTCLCCRKECCFCSIQVTLVIFGSVETKEEEFVQTKNIN